MFLTESYKSDLSRADFKFDEYWNEAGFQAGWASDSSMPSRCTTDNTARINWQCGYERGECARRTWQAGYTAGLAGAPETLPNNWREWWKGYRWSWSEAPAALKKIEKLGWGLEWGASRWAAASNLEKVAAVADLERVAFLWWQKGYSEGAYKRSYKRQFLIGKWMLWVVIVTVVVLLGFVFSILGR